MEEGRYAQVAVSVPVSGTFDYAVPEGMEVTPGVRVWVPYGRRKVTGLVLETHDRPHTRNRRPRQVLGVLDADPLLPPRLVQVILREADRIACPPGIALFAALPPGTTPRVSKRLVLLEAGARALETGQAPGELGMALRSLRDSSQSESRIRTRFPKLAHVWERLEQLGWLRRESSTDPPRIRIKTERVYRVAPHVDLSALRERLVRAPRQRELLAQLVEADKLLHLPSSPSLRVLVESGSVLCEEREMTRGEVVVPLVSEDEIPVPTEAQRAAIDNIVDAIDGERGQPFLLYGITGSGKTEVYLRAAEQALARERGVIVLVPEISLTHQLVDRFRARFGDEVAVLHSGLSDGERFDQWRRLREGVHPIAIGARSAVFAPIERLGLIVIDEEHDGAYKSDEGFRYHARDLAEQRAQSEGAPLVLGGATPDVATMYRAQRGEIERLVLPERVASRPLPEVELVDMGRERRHRGKPTLLSGALRRAIGQTLGAKQQAILFVNRRGFATYVYCFNCGHAIHCRHCDIALVYHSTDGPRRADSAEQGELRCHYCGYCESPQPRCPECLSPEGGMAGFGTERIVEEVQALFPQARIARLDRDTSQRKGAQRSILASFHRGESDILVGTQMVAKGHDIPAVTLVGVVAADLGLHFPDFRAGERTFQLLTQVAGRAGRGVDPGRVVVQTFLPDHYSINLAKTHDYAAFYREELRRREPHGYPPFRELSQLALSGTDAAAVEAASQLLAGRVRELSQGNGVELLGPAPAPLARIRDRFRWQILLLGSAAALRDLAAVLTRDPTFRPKGVKVRLVPSPLQML